MLSRHPRRLTALLAALATMTAADDGLNVCFEGLRYVVLDGDAADAGTLLMPGLLGGLSPTSTAWQLTDGETGEVSEWLASGAVLTSELVPVPRCGGDPAANPVSVTAVVDGGAPAAAWRYGVTVDASAADDATDAAAQEAIWGTAKAPEATNSEWRTRTVHSRHAGVGHPDNIHLDVPGSRGFGDAVPDPWEGVPSEASDLPTVYVTDADLDKVISQGREYL